MTSTPLCRDAGPGDAAALAALARRCFTETFGHLYKPEDLAAFLAQQTEENWHSELTDPDFHVRVAEQDGAPVGFSKLGPHKLPVPARGPTAELRQFYILSAFHGSGLARTMMADVLAAARTRGAVDLVLSVFVDNHRARRFYEGFGFERVGSYDFMVGNQRDEDDLMRVAL